MPENANDRFERLAREFFDATGFMAPGKDQAAELHGADYNARIDAWRKWNAERAEAMEADAERWRAIEPALDELREQLDRTVRAEDGPAPRLRDALIGQHSDSTFYSEWERNKQALVALLDAIEEAPNA